MLETMNDGAVRLRLPEILAEKGWTQTELAIKTGLSKNAVSQLCRNPVGIKLETIEMLLKALGITPAELFEYKPDD
jgi:DNA-binding Xre family transcriptional regulator